MRYISTVSLASLGFVAIVNVSAIAAEQCGGMTTSSGLPGYTHQCSVTSRTNIDESVLADAGEHKSCGSDCAQVYSLCKTSRGRDCRQEYKACSWKCVFGAAITIR
jgi:hypothetical protein